MWLEYDIQNHIKWFAFRAFCIAYSNDQTMTSIPYKVEPKCVKTIDQASYVSKKSSLFFVRSR